MQSVVTGQAPITLERKIISGGKQIKTEDNKHITETNRIPQTKIKRWDQRTYVSRYISYAKRVATETETEETAQYPQEKDRMKQTKSKPISKKEKEEKKKKKINLKNVRKKTAREEKTHASGSQGARGGV